MWEQEYRKRIDQKRKQTEHLLLIWTGAILGVLGAVALIVVWSGILWA